MKELIIVEYNRSAKSLFKYTKTGSERIKEGTSRERDYLEYVNELLNSENYTLVNILTRQTNMSDIDRVYFLKQD